LTLSFSTKLKLFLRSIKILKNWYYYPLIHFKLIKKPYIFLKTKNGLELKIRTSPSTDIHIFTEIWLMNIYSKFASQLIKDGTIIDVGAHTGLFVTFFSRICSEGKIICYEPNRENYEILKENIQINNLNNVILNKQAVLSKPGFITLFLNDHDSASHSVIKKTKNSVKVEATTIKKIFENNSIKYCELLKLDCEGSEFDILINLENELFHKIKKMIIEYHNIPEVSFTDDDLIKKLKENNFEVKYKSDSEKSGLIFAENTNVVTLNS